MEQNAAADAAAGAQVKPNEEEGEQIKAQILADLIEKKSQASKLVKRYTAEIRTARGLSGGVSEPDFRPHFEERKNGAAGKTAEAGADLRENSDETVAGFKKKINELTEEINLQKQVDPQLKAHNLALNANNAALHKALSHLEICFNCGSRGGDQNKLLKCTECSLARYCKKDCQIQDFRHHKHVCSAMSTTGIIEMKDVLTVISTEALHQELATLKQTNAQEKLKMEKELTCARACTAKKAEEAKKWHDNKVKMEERNDLLESKLEQNKKLLDSKIEEVNLLNERGVELEQKSKLLESNMEQKNKLLDSKIEELNLLKELLDSKIEELNLLKEGGTSKTECVVCLSAAPVMALLPCGHRCACEGCGQELKSCPMCRKDVKEVKRIFD